MPHNAPSTNNSKPTVLVTCSLASPYATEKLTATLTELARSAFEALGRAGAEVRFVEASAPGFEPGEALDGVDAVLVLGGADIDPSLYGQRPEVETIYGVNRTADEFEIEIIRKASEHDLPLLGICRGLQLINIAHGGTLHQEVGAGSIHYSSADNSVMTSHAVDLEPASRLGRIYGQQSLEIRSGHHQAIDQVAEGFRVAARALDGVIEAIEPTSGKWTIAVQWHPEDIKANREDLDRLVCAFIDEAKNKLEANYNESLADPSDAIIGYSLEAG